MVNVICTTTSDGDVLDLFSRAKYLALINESGEVIHRELNPALKSSSRRPAVARRCVELGANIVLAPHGSLCYPSYMILRRAGVNMYVVEPGVSLRDGLMNKSPVGQGEVLYSSFLAIMERIREVLTHD
ncbi:NifB/NifX family molybdenum-iron cluster-binding protein [Vulcanisaeta thermophila]|uniref:NifB/NifX family molybdenum-iron cluster-binding protein n=1 Tax=Vulcanisaeta thermophila TaxID=867917 RepID=UPI000A034C22|nr:NifB/NifX family molybdenum-iron cluster-binding protein [Vulcanisaeta thermophila]